MPTSRTANSIIAAVGTAVEDAAKRPDVPIPENRAAEAAAAVEAKVAPAVAAIVAHATNQEPWYQSRVTLGALLAAVAGLAGVFGYAFPAEMQGKVLDAIIAAGPIVGAALALWGRWIATKPLGS